MRIQSTLTFYLLNVLLIRPCLSVNHAAYFTRGSWKYFRTRLGDFSNNCMCSVAKAGYIGTEGRKDVLRLAVAMRQRQWFEGVWDKSKSFDLPVTFSPVFTP